MAIRRPGVTQVRLPEIGRIFKGSPKQINPKKNDGSLMQGTDLDYFRFEPSASTHNLPSPDNNGTLAEYLVRQYAELGDAPRALPIQFLHSEVEKDFNAEHNEVWAKIGGVERCITRCDGAMQKLHLVEQNGKKMLSNAPIACAAAEGMNKCPLGCKPTGRLFFIMPCLNYPGLVILTTHSIYDILEIEGNLAMYSNWDLNKIPFQLCRTEKTISRTNDDGSKTPMKKWLCHLSIDPRFGNAVLAAQPKQYYAELTGGIEWDAEFVDVTPQSQLPSGSDLPELPPSAVRDWSQIKKWTEFTSEQIKNFALSLGHPPTPKNLTEEQSDSLFKCVLTNWAWQSFPTAFKAYPHAANALSKVAEAIPECSDRELMDAWAFDASRREEEATQSSMAPESVPLE
jgi:Recombination directionality factor-like